LKAIRTVVNSNKGIFSFWLLLFFLTAATGRNVVPAFQDLHLTEKGHDFKPGKYDVSAAADESDLGTLSPKDSDVDDVEFTYYSNYSSQRSVVVSAEQHDFVEVAEHYPGYNVPLYDLYCNWKFHLS
jgi:hypothetical protein